MPEKLEMQSANGCQLNLEALYQIAPSCFTEAKGPDGKTRRAVNFDVLRQLLGDAAADTGEEFYQFTWPGKAEARREAARPIKKTLRPVVEDSVDWDTTQNLYIEGDNLEVLKLLQKSYLGKVKMIYIDPPYNTGNDFVYDDDFSQSAEDYAEASGDVDAFGNRYRRNTDSNGRFHSDWCSMIFPRLQLARTLLSEDGVILISIDENEIENLRKMADEIFGSENFVAQFIWRGGRRNAAKFISTSHEYMLCFTKSLHYCNEHNVCWHEKKKGLIEIYTKAEDFVKQSNGNFAKASELLKAWYRSLPEDNESKAHSHYSWIDKKGVYFASDISRGGGGGPKWTVINPETGNKVTTPSRGWAYSSEEELINDIKNGLVHFNGDGVPCKKRYLKENETQLRETVFYKDRRGSSKRLRTLMEGDVFDFPKDETIIMEFIDSFTNKCDLILDFFSGSATTAHAVFLLNAEDGGERRFIMAQLPEETEEDSEARKAGYANICEIGKERIRRAGQKIKKELQDKLGQLESRSGARYAIGDDCDKPTNLWSCLETKDKRNELDAEAYNIKEKLDNLDIGFRVFRVDDSNMEDVYFQPKSYSQDKLDMFLDNIKADRTDLDLLFGAMLDWGVQLSLPMSTKKVKSEKLKVEIPVYVVNEGDLVACFAKDISEEVIEFIAEQSPLRVLLRDICFASDADKINIFEQFKQRLSWSDEEAYKNIRVI